SHSAPLCFSTASASTELSPLSLHDALPILLMGHGRRAARPARRRRRGLDHALLQLPLGDQAADRLPAALAGARPGRLRGRQEVRSEEHTSELQSLTNLVCRLLLENKQTHRP